ncbi:DUF6873 family GME fold protein [Paramaledivibacter caminithermalis]|jgi:uncharacterized protein (UPF0212 family)|uniref:DUF6873 domain-containing protein n=1 Tax=Paramaledivibacter caminithermalis (strain DSM 15212 / CIP 107654 / DViRD3) TaxID=1121301 RepID=A0A1M6PZ12_PARC5|nr:hypothetical protein [Paramaledivibacter caminithermalis]SHK13127.1 hypothetical protein SAMN02745912_02356 [Paramaledivibacter caminithermalis DSM 15212]
MERFIKNPFIPNSKVQTVIVDKRISKCVRNKIRSNGINIIETPYCSSLYKAVSCHPDMLIHHIGGNEIIVAPNIYDEIYKKLKKLNFKVIEGNTVLKSTYPDNIAYNVCRIGKFAIHNFKYTDKEIIKRLEKKEVELINVKQGYAKCSICIVNEKAIITSDKGIAKVLEKHNIDVLTIKSGYIDLPSLNYGFIGGASGLISNDKILFCGDIRKHPDFKIIQKFLDIYSVEIEIVDNKKLIDVGSIIPITEIDENH